MISAEWCRMAHKRPLPLAVLDDVARLEEALVRYVIWPELYAEDGGEAGA